MSQSGSRAAAFLREVVPLDAWRERALPDLAENGDRVGINWTGARLVGWELTVAEVVNRLKYARGEER